MFWRFRLTTSWVKKLITVATQEKLSRLIHEVYLFELLAIVVKLRQREKGILWLHGIMAIISDCLSEDRGSIPRVVATYGHVVQRYSSKAGRTPYGFLGDTCSTQVVTAISSFSSGG